MSELAKSILTQTLTLPVEDQRFIVNGVLDHLEPEEEFEILNDPEYRAELNRRIEEVGKSTADCIPLEDALKDIRAELELDLTKQKHIRKKALSK